MDPQSQTNQQPQPAFQNTQTETAEVQPIVEVKKPKSNFLSILLVVLILVLMGVSAFLGYQNWQLQQEIKRFEEIIKVDNAPYEFPSPTPTPDPTANWETYTNTEYGFSVKYPSNVSIFEDNSTSEFNLGFNLDSNSIFIITADTDYPPGETEYYFDTEATGTRTMGEVTWNEFYLAEGYTDAGQQSSPPLYALQTTNNSVLFKVIGFYSMDLDDQVLQILSTFQFTN